MMRMNDYYAYNNEAIAFYCLYSVMSKVQTLELSKYSLILPFLLNDKVINAINNSQDEIDLDVLVSKGIINVATFNNKYVNLLPVTINSSIMLNELGILKWENETISIQKEIENIDFSEGGERLLKILSVVERFANLLGNTPALQLYTTLKILL